MVKRVALDVYFDYCCPFAYRVSLWLKKVREEMGDGLGIRWKYFSLEQVKSQQGPGGKVWEQPDDCPTLGLWAFRAAEAARLQGEDGFERFHSVVLDARHEQDRDIADLDVLVQLASEAGLELPRFRDDLGRRKLLTRLAEDHTFAVDNLGVFGTPTLVFPGGHAVFLKMAGLPPAEECLPLFYELLQLATARAYIQELKRPQLSQ